jgi:hypothetical protein
MLAPTNGENNQIIEPDEIERSLGGTKLPG